MPHPASWHRRRLTIPHHDKPPVGICRTKTPTRDLVEKQPEGSSRQDMPSWVSSTFIGRRAMSWRRASHAATSSGPKGRQNARRPKSIRAVSTETRGSTAMAKSSGNRAARGCRQSTDQTRTGSRTQYQSRWMCQCEARVAAGRRPAKTGNLLSVGRMREAAHAGTCSG